MIKISINIFFESVWDWHHPPCRLQAKGIATQYYKLTGRLINIYQASQETFHKIQEGYIPPASGLRRNHEISFEEYGALKLPHLEPYEKNEWDSIINEMQIYGIDEIEYEYLKKPKQDSSNDVKSNVKGKAGRKPSREKQELKDRFVFEYEVKIQNTEISCAKAAREFFSKLENNERVHLFRSPAEYDPLTYEEAEKRAERTICEYYTAYRNRNSN